MAQINSFQDLLDLLDSNPQYLEDLRAKILSAELLALPEKFAELVAQMAELNRRFDEFVVATNRRLDALESDVSVLKEDVSILKEDVSILKEDVSILKEDVRELKSDVKTLKDDMALVKGGQTESRALNNILNIAKDVLGLSRGRILFGGSGEMDAQLRAALDQAESQGLITEDELDNLLVTDIIIRARRAFDRQYVYAVIEVSHTINNRDIDRARDRARTLALATGDEALPVALGGVVRPLQRRRADEAGVHVVIPAMFGEERLGDDDD